MQTTADQKGAPVNWPLW